MEPLDLHIRLHLNADLENIENHLDADLLTIISPILFGLDEKINLALKEKISKRDKVAIVLDTPGGVVEVVERMVNTVRHFYKDVIFIIPDKAMSAGTIFALSGDRIMMNYYSCLGPIDPQIEKNGKLVPALAYLDQLEKMRDLASDGKLTTIDVAMVEKLDLAELEQFEQAKKLSRDLLIEWLSKYKFKNWLIHQTTNSGTDVTEDDRKERAAFIADTLSNNQKWHSHGRGINMNTLQDELKLQIEDMSQQKELEESVLKYFGLLKDYMNRHDKGFFIHTKEMF